jgi:hypothetical protein
LWKAIEGETMKLQKVWICKECNQSYSSDNSDVHKLRCSGQLSAHYSKDGLVEMVKDRIQYHEKRFGDEISHNILIELKSLLRELDG